MKALRIQVTHIWSAATTTATTPAAAARLACLVFAPRHVLFPSTPPLTIQQHLAESAGDVHRQQNTSNASRSNWLAAQLVVVVVVLSVSPLCCCCSCDVVIHCLCSLLSHFGMKSISLAHSHSHSNTNSATVPVEDSCSLSLLPL